MIDSYLTSLKKGLNKNKDEYMKLNNVNEEEMRIEHANNKFVECMST
jgi:hypothetical protein